MPYDLTTFGLGDMLKSSPRLREAATGAPTFELAAQRVCRFLYDELRNAEGQRQCALVRCYKTNAFGSLEPELQEFVRTVMGFRQPWAAMKCLTLMATVGQTAAWNSRHNSRGHRAIPLPSPEIIEKAPMISQLIKEFGLEVSSVIQPSPRSCASSPANGTESFTSRTRWTAPTYRRRRNSSCVTESSRCSDLAAC